METQSSFFFPFKLKKFFVSFFIVQKALDKCRTQEEKIVHLQGPLERLRKSAQTEFDKVSIGFTVMMQINTYFVIKSNAVRKMNFYRNYVIFILLNNVWNSFRYTALHRGPVWGQNMKYLKMGILRYLSFLTEWLPYKIAMVL